MEIDPNYEYEAPKWFDFTTNFEGEVNDNLSLHDSWFERVHPLHEPRDPSHHDATSKPLLTSNQGTTTAPSCSKPQTKNPVKKNYNSKKSLGIKTVRTKRGQHDNPNHREDSGTGSRNSPCHTQKKETSLKDAKRGSRGKSEVDGRLTPSEVQHSFTPPWINSPITKQEEITRTNKVEGKSGSLGELADFLPQRVPVPQSQLSSVHRIRGLKSSSMSPCSPKSSMLSKAVTGNVQRVGRKRRLLPSVPDTKKNPCVSDKMIFSSPSHYSNQLDINQGYKKLAETSSVSKNSDQLTYGSKQGFPSSALSNMDEKPLLREEVFDGNSKPLCTTELCLKRETVNHAQHCSDEFYRQERNMVSERSRNTILEAHNQALAEIETDKERSLRGEKVALNNDMSLEELLKQHNKKIIAARNQYDENGRKIRTAEPSFCPAPSKKLMMSLKSPSSSVLSKVHTNTSKRGKETLKQQTARQKRRSCVASLQNSTQTNTADKELRDLIAQHNSRVTAKRM